MHPSETGDRAGFTLIEILLVVALIGLVGWIFIGGSAALMTNKESPDDQFWKATAAARKEALEEGRSVVMTFDTKAKGFAINDGNQRKVLPVVGADDLVIDFHPVQSDSSSSVLIGGTLVETEPLAAVTFYNDGTCTPFRVQIRANGAAHILSVDPWTCAQVLNQSDANP
jgi:prepilin-type N-terminal cleavage/methylation domain-containing protein